MCSLHLCWFVWQCSCYHSLAALSFVPAYTNSTHVRSSWFEPHDIMQSCCLSYALCAHVRVSVLVITNTPEVFSCAVFCTCAHTQKSTLHPSSPLPFPPSPQGLSRAQAYYHLPMNFLMATILVYLWRSSSCVKDCLMPLVPCSR